MWRRSQHRQNQVGCQWGRKSGVVGYLHPTTWRESRDGHDRPDLTDRFQQKSLASGPPPGKVSETELSRALSAA